MFWKDNIKLEIKNYTTHHIDSSIGMDDGGSWRFIVFYGRPEDHRRWESWALMDHLYKLDSRPWLCCGDFNEILT